MRIVKNSSLLRIDAPEWCPHGTMVKRAPEDEKKEDEPKEHEWKKPKKVFKKKSSVKGIKLDTNDNRFQALSDEYADKESEDEVEHNLEKEMMREIKQCNETIHFLEKRNNDLE